VRRANPSLLSFEHAVAKGFEFGKFRDECIQILAAQDICASKITHGTPQK
jgi:hypothetical protein